MRREPHVRFREGGRGEIPLRYSSGVAPNVCGHPGADRPPPGAACAGMRGQGEQMRRATRGEVCLDAGKTMRISVSGPLTAGFERRLLATKQFAVAQANQKGRSGPRPAGFWRMSV